jgi:hypothetical protein
MKRLMSVVATRVISRLKNGHSSTIMTIFAVISLVTGFLLPFFPEPRGQDQKDMAVGGVIFLTWGFVIYVFARTLRIEERINDVLRREPNTEDQKKTKGEG